MAAHVMFAVVAGAVASPVRILIATAARRIELSRHTDGAISAAKAQLVTDAVLRKCDTLNEGFLNDPRACTFDFEQLACATAIDNDACLTPLQISTVEEFYGGVKNGTGDVIRHANLIRVAFPVRLVRVAECREPVSRAQFGEQFPRSGEQPPRPCSIFLDEAVRLQRDVPCCSTWETCWSSFRG
jgi:hypothetical protein